MVYIVNIRSNLEEHILLTIALYLLFKSYSLLHWRQNSVETWPRICTLHSNFRALKQLYGDFFVSRGWGLLDLKILS